MRAVITAGGPLEGEYARIAGTAVKALAPVRGRSMLARAIDAARAVGIGEIAVIGDARVHEACGTQVERFVEAAPSGAQNVLRALGVWPDDRPLLYLTSDMPYIDEAALHDFVVRAPSGALAMPLTEHRAFTRRFPDAPPFGITLRGERVVNGGAFIIPAGACGPLSVLAARFFDARKAPWRMASLVGLPFALKFAFRRLSIAELEAHALRVLGVAAVGVRNCAPELAFDADVIEEYRYAREHP